MTPRRITQIQQHRFFRAGIAAGEDAADRQVEAAGRNSWNAEDAALAVAVMWRLLHFAAVTQTSPLRMAA